MAVTNEKNRRPSPGPLPAVAGRLALICGLLLLAACAAPQPLHQTAPSNLQWPPQGSGPRVVWLKSIAGSQDAGISKGFWRRALELIIGGDERRIVQPYGVLYDAAERLLIADPGAGVVHLMDTRQGRYTVIGQKEGLRTPIGLAEDPAGKVYITDSGAGVVFRYDAADGSLTPFLGKGVVRRPTGITYNKVKGLLYIVDTLANQVLAVDLAGNEKLRFGSAGDGPGAFNRPTDIASDDAGELYLTDALNYQILIYSADGQPVGQFGTAGDALGNLNKPKGIAVDSERHIYVCDALLDAVQVFDKSGQLLLTFGGNGTGNGAFWMPSGLFIDGHDDILVADTYNKRIQVFRYFAGGGAPAPQPQAPDAGGRQQ